MTSDRFEIDVAATAAEVWNRLTTSDGLGSWFGTDATIDLRIQGARVVRWGDAETMDAEITDLDAPNRIRLAYVVDGAEVGAEEWLISSHETTTRVTLITSMPPGDTDDWDGFVGDVRRGWRLFMASLRFALTEAAHPDRIAVCRHLPATGPRPELWEAVQSFLDTSDLVEGLEPVLLDPPHSRLLVASDRSLLLDAEGWGADQVLYAQAATHAGPDEWRELVLDAVAGALADR